MTKTIKWRLETVIHSAQWSGEIILPNVATEEEINEAVREQVHNIINWTWWVEKTDDPVPTMLSTSQPERMVILDRKQSDNLLRECGYESKQQKE